MLQGHLPRVIFNKYTSIRREKKTPRILVYEEKRRSIRRKEKEKEAHLEWDPRMPRLTASGSRLRFSKRVQQNSAAGGFSRMVH